MNPLYSFRATEELGNDSWGGLVVATCEVPQADLARTFAHWEADYKSTVNAPIPSAWRSAKSVLIRARAAGVPVLDGAGASRGKTAVEIGIKAAQGAIAEGSPKSPEEILHGLLRTAHAYAKKHGLNYIDFAMSLRS